MLSWTMILSNCFGILFEVEFKWKIQLVSVTQINLSNVWKTMLRNSTGAKNKLSI